MNVSKHNSDEHLNLKLAALCSPACQAVFPPRKFYTEEMFGMLRTKRMQLRNYADTQTV